MFRIPHDTEMTEELLQDLLDKHRDLVTKRFEPLHKMYIGEHAILTQLNKPLHKPDNRIVVNFAKYIVDTMTGFFLGIPIKVISKESTIFEYIDFLYRYNVQEDKDSEISKVSSIYGRAYEIYYNDEDAELCTMQLSPLESFMVYDESLLERPLYFVRRYETENGEEIGSISDANSVRYFYFEDKTLIFDHEKATIHHFGDVPATEYVENEEKIGIFESVISMIDAYNKAISEKANDVDYFADAYLKILGAEVSEEDLTDIRSNRVINIEGIPDVKLDVNFLNKPNGDQTQEHLIERLEKLIFQISMVANISDNHFGSSSGIALKYKLQAMVNLAKTKERKFIKSMNRRYRLLFSNPASQVPKESWYTISYKFTANIPAFLNDEAEMARSLQGIVSKETQLKSLSIVDDINKEIERIRQDALLSVDDFDIPRRVDEPDEQSQTGEIEAP